LRVKDLAHGIRFTARQAFLDILSWVVQRGTRRCFRTAEHHGWGDRQQAAHPSEESTQVIRRVTGELAGLVFPVR
jgi:hypothetical protein